MLLQGEQAGTRISCCPPGIRHARQQQPTIGQNRLPTMLNDKELEAAANRLAAYRTSDALNDILTHYDTLLNNYKLLKSDYEEEREARERWKQQARGQERNPFVLVLVDADGYIFNDELIAAGHNGGGQAAQLLNHTVKASQEKKGLEHCETMVRVYANVAGLSKALAKWGLLGADKRSLGPFIANFNRSYGLSDFVDAGEFKENADFKLREMLRLYAENTQCKHIYFAACHDAGYVSQLTAYRGQKDRFTLIKAPSLHFHDEFAKLGLSIEELPGVFRSAGSAMDALCPKPLQSAGKPYLSLSTARTQTVGLKETCTFHSAGKCIYGEYCKNLHVGPTPLVMRRSKLSLSPWRNGSEAYNTIDYSLPDTSHGASSRSYLQKPHPFAELPRRDEMPDGYVAINRAQQRLDAYMPVPTPESEARLKVRSAVKRLCNTKTLTGSCTNPHCEYDHGPLDEDLVPTLEWLARSIPCPRREKCRNAACTAGHLCQKPDCKNRGGKVFCRFTWGMHFDDLAVDRYLPAISNRQTASPRAQHTTPLPSDHANLDTNGDGADGEDEKEGEETSSANGGLSVDTL
ncbi:hypothetical protein J7T55_010619 [Diaporthe amygdali]|uniref:uncharacterized protein n=1 Tax=Phomopsis amygdali TaxID=1214568 RepID=UPI0022FDBBB4|nr:uncharacterized protein J7T55_010619 [Diaporthe amygdali]KAJ0100722.1 hypothetical protein J7T55_010619 [Diaporthe amygdali]